MCAEWNILFNIFNAHTHRAHQNVNYEHRKCASIIEITVYGKTHWIKENEKWTNERTNEREKEWFLKFCDCDAVSSYCWTFVKSTIWNETKNKWKKYLMVVKRDYIKNQTQADIHSYHAKLHYISLLIFFYFLVQSIVVWFIIVFFLSKLITHSLQLHKTLALRKGRFILCCSMTYNNNLT